MHSGRVDQLTHSLLHSPAPLAAAAAAAAVHLLRFFSRHHCRERCVTPTLTTVAEHAIRIIGYR